LGHTTDRVSAIVEALEKFSFSGNARVTLAEPEIGGSGINREVKIEPPALAIAISNLGDSFKFQGKPGPKSLSLVRYVFGDDPMAKEKLKGYLEQLSQITPAAHPASIGSLALVQIDKVAYSFDVLGEYHFA
jgi:hypothetical protein